MKEYKINFKKLIAPILVWAAGLILVILSAPKTENVNGLVLFGLFLLCIGTYWALYALYKEYDKTGKEWPFFLENLFPDYPLVEDETALMRRLSRFRESYSAFLSSPRAEQNSTLQSTATQLMWHSAALQKKRLMKNDLTIQMDSVRRAYSDKRSCVRENSYFDGRYMVDDVYEEISALRTIRRGGKLIKRIKDNEVAHFTLLSAKQVGKDEVVCPNCGSATSRENLLDGCDYCGTRFTVEDMENRVDSFGLRHDIRTNTSKKRAIREIMLPWTTLAVTLPLIYFGLVGAFVYMPDESIFARSITGLFAAALLGLFGWALKSLVLYSITPLLLLIFLSSKSMDRKLICSREKEEEQERRMADQVRQSDPLFSIQSFFGGVQNKLSAIHYADSAAEINAFSVNDMSSYVKRYKNVVDIDFLNITMGSYSANDTAQIATVGAELRLLELRGDKIKERIERLKITMVKDAGCKTQAVCGASVLKCSGCGASLSLMDGKTCDYCGRELDYKLYDWVITKYEII